jgi:hypothetical protein
MAKIDFSKEWIKQNAEKIKMAYKLVVSGKLNIRSKEVALELLAKIDPQNANEENVEGFSKVLQLFDQKVKERVLEKEGSKKFN